MHNSVRIIQNVCSFTSVFLRRSSNAAVVTVRPQLSDKQRRTIDSCCTVEVTADRLSYAFLRLDLEDRNSVILSSWNSLPLNLPSGKEFRPSVCSSTFKSVAQLLLNDICSPENSTSSQSALVYVSSKLSSSSLIRAGFMGYLIGCLCTEVSSLSYFPVFTMNYSYRKSILSSWKSNFLKKHSSESITNDIIEDIFMLLPKLSTRHTTTTNNNHDNNYKLDYCRIFNVDDNTMNSNARVLHDNDEGISYNQLSLVNVLVDGYAFLVHGVMVCSICFLKKKAFHCCNILKEQILSDHNVPLNMDVILRPVVPSSCFTTTAVTTGKYPKDNLIMHQAVVTGYLLAFLSNLTDDEFHQNCQASISVKCPTVETLVNWTNQSTSHWVQYLNQLFSLSFKNDQFVTFNLLPKSSKHLCVVKNSKIMPVQEEINMRLQSEQLLSVFRASNITKRKDATTMQFLLARCLFTCMYHLFHDNYSRIV
ncbi:unnamed protein product [Trichobilharzia szidati]|nr:unnamed protein product [Trichobilharzia szidati]